MGDGRAFVGISGYDYKHWRGRFYPQDLPRGEWFRYASRRFDSIELNGTFYSLKSPPVFERWVQQAPKDGFVLAMKGSRFITHNLKLRRAEQGLANFLASGILAQGRLTGPFLWQLPDTYRYDRERIEGFLRVLPRGSEEAAALAREHDARLTRGALTEPAARVRYRHALEVRHPSYFVHEFYDLLRAHGCAFVIADTAGKFSYAEEVTTGFVYVRLHGSRALYASEYTDAELETWATKVAAWTGEGRDVYVYFDNDAQAFAPHDASRLAERVRGQTGARRVAAR